jgi:hypothetical protein
MSTALAVAAVTAALRQQFSELYNEPEVSSSIGTTVTVSAQAPSNFSMADGDPPRLNVFLYQVSPNSGFASLGLPVRNGRGQRVGAPPLCLDLHYLLTAYGQQDFEAETLLGHAMQMLHERPGLGRRRLREMATSASDTRVRTILASSALAEQVEMIKFSMQPMGGEEISKLWTAFQSEYRPSAAYHASVVLIESDTPTRAALPVTDPRIHVRPLQRPHIESVQPQVVEAGDTVVLRGHSFAASAVQIVFGGLAPQTIEPDSDTEISIALPAGMEAGVNTVQVAQPVDVDPGPGVDLRPGSDSNVAPFILAPEITTTPIPSVAAGDPLTLDVSPPVGGRQRAELLIGERAISTSPRLDSSGEPVTASTLSFDIPSSIGADTYLVRLRIDGAESALQQDGDGRYIGPEVTVT